MIKIIFTLIFFFFVALFGVWLNNNNFPIVVDLLDYKIETTAAKLLVLVLILLVAVYSVLRFLSWVKNSPRKFASKLQKDKEKQGYRDLMQGFSALAAGDMSHAKKLGERASKALKEEPLVKLLQAQTCVLANKPFEAEVFYKELADNDESRIVGYRGLINQAIENGELPRALELSEDLHKLNPSSEWVNESMIDLAMRNAEWDKVEKYTLKAKKGGALNKQQASINLAITYYSYAREHYAEEDFSAAVADLKKALKHDAQFLPAIILLARALLDGKEFKAAAKHVEASWKKFPHPELAEIYGKVLDETAPDKKLKKFEKLLKSNSGEVESVIAYVREAIAQKNYESARTEIERGLEIRETKKLCYLMAEAQLEGAAQEKWKERASAAKSDKVWYCVETGSECKKWHLYSNSGFFNTMIWGYNNQISAEAGNLQNPIDSFLLIK